MTRSFLVISLLLAACGTTSNTGPKTDMPQYYGLQEERPPEKVDEQTPPNMDGVPRQFLGDLDKDEQLVLAQALSMISSPCRPGSHTGTSVLDALKAQPCAEAVRTGLDALNLAMEGHGANLIVRRLMEQRAERAWTAVDTSSMNLNNRPTKGPANAKVTVVKFMDYACSHCRRANSAVEKVLTKGNVRVVYKFYPNPYHQQSRVMATIAYAAAHKGVFPAVHDKLMKLLKKSGGNPTDMDVIQIMHHAGIMPNDFGAQASVEMIDTDVREANNLKITGLPTFFVNGVKCDAANLEKVVDAALAK